MPSSCFVLETLTRDETGFWHPPTRGYKAVLLWRQLFKKSCCQAVTRGSESARQASKRPIKPNSTQQKATAQGKKSADQPALVRRAEWIPTELTCRQRPSCRPGPSGSRRTTGPRGWPAACPWGPWGQCQSAERNTGGQSALQRQYQ